MPSKNRPTVLHLVDHAFPRQSGYSVRTHYMALSQKQENLAPIVAWCPPEYSSMGYEGGVNEASVSTPEGITHLRYPLWRMKIAKGRSALTTHFNVLFGKPNSSAEHGDPRIADFAKWLQSKVGRIDVVHAHSPPSVGITGAALSEYLQVPFVYEIRGFWKLSAASNQGRSVDMDDALALDISVASRASRVVTLSTAMSEALTERGVPPEKIKVLPNAVDDSAFQTISRDFEKVRQLKLENKFVFGYITNVRRMEGIQTILDGWKNILAQVPNAQLLIVGDGKYLPALREQCAAYGLEDYVHFAGRVPHEEVLDYYSLIDVFIVARTPDTVCALVPPLKPLEAMALGIPLVVSDLPPLTEMVKNQERGWTFKPGDANDLARACVSAALEVEKRLTFAQNGLSWVKANRTWRAVSKEYRSLYESIAV